MEFQIEKNSPVPVIKQIQEQIKLSIAMGLLKRGDILPSIREVEKQTGINRGQIHRAYLALHRSGLLSPASGKRAAIAVSAAAPDTINKECRRLSKDIGKRIRKIGVSPIAFARYLSRNMQEEERKSPVYRLRGSGQRNGPSKGGTSVSLMARCRGWPVNRRIQNRSVSWKQTPKSTRQPSHSR